MRERRENGSHVGAHRDAPMLLRALQRLPVICVFLSILLALESFCFSPPPSPLSIPSDNPLIEACRHGDKQKVMSLINQGQAVNIIDRNGLFPLQIASYMGRMEIVRILFAHGADVNFNSSRGVAVSVAKTEEIALFLIANGADIYHARPDGNGYPLSYALFGSAAAKGWDMLLCVLHDKIHDVNAPGLNEGTALFGAAGFGKLSTLKMLIEWGADVNYADKYGKTPLIAACSHVQIDTARALLQAGSNPNHKMKNGVTVLEATTMRCWSPSPVGYPGDEKKLLSLIKLLIRSGAVVRKENLESFSKVPSLTYACQDAFALLQAEYGKSKAH